MLIKTMKSFNFAGITINIVRDSENKIDSIYICDGKFIEMFDRGDGYNFTLENFSKELSKFIEDQKNASN